MASQFPTITVRIMDPPRVGGSFGYAEGGCDRCSKSTCSGTVKIAVSGVEVDAGSDIPKHMWAGMLFACPNNGCISVFVDSAEMVDHLAFHAEVREYKCVLCGNEQQTESG